MTLLAAVKTHELVHVAADSLEVWQTAGYGGPADKLYQLGDHKVVWGYYGPDGPGCSIRKYVDERSFVSWDDLAYHLEGAVALLDREHRGVGGFATLFAGFLKDQWQIRVFGAHHLKSDDWCFVGQNRLATKVGWQVAGEADQESRLRRVMKTVIDASHPLLGPPLNMWRITPTECVRCAE